MSEDDHRSSTEEQPRGTAGPLDDQLLSARAVRKRYGPTLAVDDVDIAVARGEVIGLVGANGAGKSTLMRILSGVTVPDDGTFEIGSVPTDWAHYSPTRASELGIRVVYQELSLSTNLTVYENFYVEQSRRFSGSIGWRKSARELAKQSLEAVFPHNSIDVTLPLHAYTIAQQQMVEIARATCDPSLRLLILDEPTSSLGAAQSEALRRFIRDRREQGVSFIFISHRLSEVLSVADRIVILQNGSIVWSGPAAGVREEDLVEKMGGGRAARLSAAGGAAQAASPNELLAGTDGMVSLSVESLETDALHGVTLSVEGGGIVGIAGLEGSGQSEFLRAIFRPRGHAKHAIRRKGHVAFVTGDRKKEGIFPFWSISANMYVSTIASARLFSWLRTADLFSVVRSWFERLGIVGSHIQAGITSLSGGNQQKVLIARSLMARSDMILLDDPTRGVDVATKQQLYGLLHEAARRGKLILWYSTEDEEFAQCDRVLVLRYGRVVADLEGEENTKDGIIQASFSGEEHGHSAEEESATTRRRYFGTVAIPFAAMLAVYALSGILSPRVFSGFGVGLLLGGAVPLVLGALSQMFIIGLSQVDLGVGAYMGLVNVLSATILYSHPLLGALCLAGCLALYSGMGALIYARRIPAIIVTLGASFIWMGTAYTIQSQPGGQSPAWLMALVNVNVPVIPEPVILVALFAAAAFAMHRSRYGTVLRGFGNNPQSMRRSGWSALKAHMVAYFFAGVFAMLGGLAVTATTTASDANASASYTLLTIAAVVMGGSMLTGGVVYPVGVVFGAITLSLIASLLGFLNVSSNWVSAVQGFILLLILALRLLRRQDR